MDYQPARYPFLETSKITMKNGSRITSLEANAVVASPRQPQPESRQSNSHQSAQPGEVSLLRKSSKADAQNAYPQKRSQEKPTFRVIAYPLWVFLDPKGNLTIELGDDAQNTGPRYVVVNSSVVARLSPVWEKLVKQSKMVSFKTPNQKHLVIKDQNPNMHVQMMRVAHGDFKNLVHCLSFKEVIDLAVICREYGMNKYLIPFLAGWTNPYRAHILQPGYEQWLYAAWQFGYQEDYLELARHLTLNCSVNDQDQLIGLNGKQLVGVFPPGCIERIQSARLEILDKLLSILKTHMRSYIESNQCLAQLPSADDNNSHSAPSQPAEFEQAQCTLVNYGSMIRALRLINYWPERESGEEIYESVNHVVAVLSNLQVIEFRGVDHDVNIGVGITNDFGNSTSTNTTTDESGTNNHTHYDRSNNADDDLISLSSLSSLNLCSHGLEVVNKEPVCAEQPLDNDHNAGEAGSSATEVAPADEVNKPSARLHESCHAGKRLASFLQAVLERVKAPVNAKTMEQVHLNASEFVVDGVRQ